MSARHVLSWLVALGIGVALGFAVSARTARSAAPTPARFPASYRAPRTADGHPDLNGIWQAFVTANWDLRDHEAQAGPYTELLGAYSGAPGGQSVVDGGDIPYKPEALARRAANVQSRLTVDLSEDSTWHARGDPEMKCYMPGVPRATYLPFPFQIVQGTSPYILIAYEFASATRIVRMDAQQAPSDSWMGWSRGRWEGDTFVVDVTGQREETWFDRAGDFHSDALHVVERYTPVSPYHLLYEATIEDPNVFTRPWVIRFPLYRRMEKDVQLLEYKCVPFTEELLFGRFRKPATR